MAVTEFGDWYARASVDERDGSYHSYTVSPKCDSLFHRYTRAKSEMDTRVANFSTLEKLANGEVISPKPDLPNVSSGETAGLIRRTARNLVQNTPNVEVVSKFDDDDAMGRFARYVLLSKIIGSDNYSNDMQQNLVSSTKSALTLGFDCVVPVLLQDAGGGWYIKYDTIHYRDVFPEPGCKDVRQATEVFVRRYLTKGEVHQLVEDGTPGWDHAALMTMLKSRPGSREWQSVDHQSKTRGQIPEGYEIITWYSSSGNHFLTFDPNTKLLLRIEKNKHPLKQHPVHFLVLEKDAQQPLGKSQVELLIGRQDFQDLMLNGAMKLWYRNINPTIIGYGAPNALPNMGPGKYTSITNPNARLEAFEVNTQTLLQYGQISEQNLGSMVNLLGTADQQMATQAGSGMSATPQGVEAQQSLVDITTNNYQKAIENFFSHYCSYALTMYFQELKAIKGVQLTADGRQKLMKAGFDPERVKPDGTVDIDFELLATEYWVRCVPGSLTELEDEKQLRILNALFVPLSQAMPALAQTQNPDMLEQAASAMKYIISKQIELSGANSAMDIKKVWDTGDARVVSEREQRAQDVEEAVGALGIEQEMATDLTTQVLQQLQQQIQLLTDNQEQMMKKLGMHSPASEATSPTPPLSAVAPAQ